MSDARDEPADGPAIPTALAILFLIPDVIIKLPVYVACGVVLAVVWVAERVKRWE